MYLDDECQGFGGEMSNATYSAYYGTYLFIIINLVNYEDPLELGSCKKIWPLAIGVLYARRASEG